MESMNQNMFHVKQFIQKFIPWLVSGMIFFTVFHVKHILPVPMLISTGNLSGLTIVYLSIFDILSISLLIIVSRETISNVKQELVACGLVIYAVISILLSQNHFLAMWTTWLFIKTIVSRETIVRYWETNRDLLEGTLILSVFTSSLIGIIQVCISQDIGLNLLGEPNLSIYWPNVAKLNVSRETFLRAYGTFGHPNILAAWIIGTLLVSRETITGYQIGVKKLIYSVLILALLLTFSKTGLISLLLLGLFHVKQLHQTIKTHKTLIFIGFLSILPIIFAYYTRITTEVSSYSERLFGISDNLTSLSLKQAFFGHGIGQSLFHVKQSATYAETWRYQPLHNVLLLAVYEVGIFGILVVYKIFKANFKRLSQSRLSQIYKTALILSPFLLSDHFVLTHFQGMFLVMILYINALNSTTSHKLD